MLITLHTTLRPGQFFRRKTNRILTQRTVNSNVMDCLVKNDNEKEIFTYIDEVIILYISGMESISINI